MIGLINLLKLKGHCIPSNMKRTTEPALSYGTLPPNCHKKKSNRSTAIEQQRHSLKHAIIRGDHKPCRNVALQWTEIS